MSKLGFRTKAVIVSAALSFILGCSRQVPLEQKTLTDVPLTETTSLGVAPAIAPESIDTIILGAPQAAAEEMLKVTLDERSALACVSLLLPRLGECSEKMDDTILVREEGQPIWMRLYSNRYAFSQGMEGRKEQILLRLADCIREATPSLERANARRTLLACLAPDFQERTSQNAEIAARAVLFWGPFAGNIREETGWEDLFRLFDAYLLSDELKRKLNDPKTASQTQNALGRVRAAYSHYCLVYPEKESQILQKHYKYLDERFTEFLEATRINDFAPRYCNERDYRVLLKMSLPEWVEIYRGKERYNAADVLEGLLTGTRQARIESFPLVKSDLAKLRETPTSYNQWIFLFRHYCVAVPEDAPREEIERHQWMMDELIGQISRNEGGDLKQRCHPISLLRFLIFPFEAEHDSTNRKRIANPYGKERALEVLLDQAASREKFAAEQAEFELKGLRGLDGDTARYIAEGLKARGVTE